MLRPLFAAFLVLFALSASGQSEFVCEDPFLPELQDNSPQLDRYASMSEKHRLKGTASYYSDFFDGRRTASGEVFRQKGFTAAHRTLPLGCWVEVKSIATGRTIRVKVNDRGPFKGGFALDLSRAAARALGVDLAADRRVEMRVLALPGEEPPAEEEGK